MNYYLDFEATQFSSRIISVGCVASNGRSFYSLVKPVNEGKVNKFIEDLTGITQEMVNVAPEADEVFADLKEFIRSQSDGNETFFFVYGDADTDFINHTAKYIEDREIQEFAYYLGASLIDYSQVVCRFFRTAPISLKKVLAYFRGTPVLQNHNALEDAEMLREVALAIANTPMPMTNPFHEEMLAREAKRLANEAAVKAKNEINGRIRMTVVGDKNAKVREFKSVQEATNFVMNSLLKKSTDIVYTDNVLRKVKSAVRTNKPYFNRKWEIIKEED